MGGRAAKILSKEDIQRAICRTLSNRGAARFLHVSFNHYKKYAKLYVDTETGKSLFEMHMNQSGKGIPKYLSNKGAEPALMDLLEGRVPSEHFDPQKIKQRIIFEAMLVEECAKCGFAERRVIDNKIPLILNHKDNNKQNFHLDNLEFLCYNCSFLYAASPITDRQVELMEEYVDKNGDYFEWELDEHHIEHLKRLGLYDTVANQRPGEEYISRI